MLEKNEGLLTKVQGKVTRITENEIFVNDNSGEARIYVNGYIGDETDNPAMLGKWDSKIKVGDTISAIGLASQDPQGHRLRVRNTSEILWLAADNSIYVTGVTLNSSSETLKVGGTFKLVATILPANASNKSLKWTSSDEKVAKVDADGKVTAIAVGTCNITVTTAEGNKTAICTIKVVEASVVTMPKTGSPIDFTVLMVLGAALLAAGLVLVVLKRKRTN